MRKIIRKYTAINTVATAITPRKIINLRNDK